mgnify:CR=1 FL=1
MFNTFSNKKRGQCVEKFPKLMIDNKEIVALVYNPPGMEHIFRGIVLISPEGQKPVGTVLKIDSEYLLKWKDYGKSLTFIGE